MAGRRPMRTLSGWEEPDPERGAADHALVERVLQPNSAILVLDADGRRVAPPVTVHPHALVLERDLSVLPQDHPEIDRRLPAARGGVHLEPVDGESPYESAVEEPPRS